MTAGSAPGSGQFEYQVLELSIPHLQHQIAAMAADGWRVTSALPVRPSVASVIFERQSTRNELEDDLRSPGVDTDPTRLYTTEEVAKQLQISSASVRNLVYERKLPALKIAGHLRYRRRDIICLFERLAQRGTRNADDVDGQDGQSDVTPQVSPNVVELGVRDR